MKKLIQNAASEAMTVKITGNDNVPKHRPAEPVRCGSPESDESLSTPQTHDRITAG